MTIVYSMDSFYIIEFGSTSVSGSSSLSINGTIYNNAAASINNTSVINVDGTVYNSEIIPINNTSIINVDGKIVTSTDAPLSAGSVIDVETTDLMLQGNASLSATSSLDIFFGTTTVRIYNNSSLSYQAIYGESSLNSDSFIYAYPIIETLGTLFAINNGGLIVNGNVVHDGKFSTINASNLSANGILADQLINQEINNDASLTATSTLGYYKYGNSEINNNSITTINGILETTGSSNLSINSTLGANTNIIHNGNSILLSESITSFDGIHINNSIYGNSTILNNSIVNSYGIAITATKLSINNTSTIDVESTIQKEYRLNAILNGESYLLVDGIVPMRQNINCDIINIVNLNNIKIINIENTKNIITDESINIKNC